VVAVATLVREERFFETLPELKEAIRGAPAQVVYYSYTRPGPRAVQTLSELGIPCFSTPARTARALGAAVDYAAFLRGMDNVAVFAARAPGTFQWPRPSGPLSELGVRVYLAPLGIASPMDCLACSADEAVSCFMSLGGQPVALKVQSPHINHKASVGGVRLRLATADQVRDAFSALVSAAPADAAIEGVLVQRMAPSGVEAFVAARREPLLGPLVVVGRGGTEVESLNDVAMRLAPVSQAEAFAMLDELRGASLLRSGADFAALAAAVVRMSELAAGLPPNVRNVEINPLLVLPPGQGVLMLDAAIELEGSEPL
jgi:acyl-CoA synthetase (NDP forming)